MNVRNAENQVTITGRVVELDEVRFSPAGIPHWSLVIDHRSEQPEAEQQRAVHCAVRVALSGSRFSQHAAQLTLGQRIRVQGFLAASSYRSKPGQLRLHAQSFDVLDIDVFDVDE